VILDDGVPAWARTLATLLIGAGGARVLAIWLENRRLTRRDYRETLLARIRELELLMVGLQERIGSLREEVAGLREQLDAESELVERLRGENDGLRARMEDHDGRRRDQPEG